MQTRTLNAEHILADVAVQRLACIIVIGELAEMRMCRHIQGARRGLSGMIDLREQP